MRIGARLSNLQARIDARLKFLISRTHARMIGVQACTHVHLSPGRPRMGGPHPLNTPVRPPIQALPKN
jgi:hypothetical protein